MKPYNQLSIAEKDAMSIDIDVRAKVYGKKRDGLIIKSQVTRAQHHKYWSKAEKESIDVKITFMELLRYAWLSTFVFILAMVAIYFKQWYFTFGLAILSLIIALVFYKYYRYRIRISWQGIEIKNEFLEWKVIYECYVVEHETKNFHQIDLLIFQTDGKMRVFDVEGVDPMLLSHYIYHYLQHYRTTSVQPS